MLAPFLRQGLEREEKVLYILDAHAAETVVRYLEEEGLNVGAYLASGQLSILTYDETYTREGTFDPERMIALLRDETERALSEGYAALRATGEMTWALRGLPGSQHLIRYEALLNEFFRDSECLAICQYDRRRFPPETLLDVLRTHPIAMVGTEIYDNFYYIPPTKLLSRDLPAVELHRCLKSLEGYKRAEDALRESEARFRAIFEGAAIGVGLTNQEGRIIEANVALQRILGYNAEELRRMTLAECMHPDDAANAQALYEELIAGRRDHYRVEGRYIRKDGQWIWGRLTTSPIRDPEGAFQFAICTLEDITERKRAEEALDLKMKQLGALIRASRVVTASLNLDQVLAGIISLAGGVVASDYASVALVDEAGRLSQSVENLPGVPSMRYRIREEGLTHWIIRTCRAAIIDEIQEDGRPIPALGKGAPGVVNPHIRKAGIKSLAGLPLIAKGRLLGVLYLHSRHPGAFHGQEELLKAFANQVAIAIENAKLYEQAQREIARRRQVEADLREALKAKDEMIQNVSHELRTPLTLIQGYVELLQEGALGPLTTAQRKAVDVLDRQSNYLHYMVERLLLLQTLDKITPRKKPLDLKAMLKDLLHTWEARAQEAGIRLQLDIPPDLPPLAADKGLLHQVFHNLLDNAVKFSPDGGEIRVHARTRDDELVIAISDQGIGIPPDELEQVFRRFYQVEGGSTRRFNGMGIGLALCRKIVESHGGRIWAESEGEGKGSTFYVALPLGDDHVNSTGP